MDASSHGGFLELLSDEFWEAIPDDLLEPLPDGLQNAPPNEVLDSWDSLTDYIGSTLPKRPSIPSVWREFRTLGIKIVVMTGIAVLIFSFMYGLHYNVDSSMYPSVRDGDLVMCYRWNKDYRAGDLVLLTFQGKGQVRRVIAAAGDTVDITEEGLVINGAPQQEPGIYQKTQRYADGAAFPITLGEGQVFVLGDAREGAADSRVYGAVNGKDIRGSVFIILRRRNL